MTNDGKREEVLRTLLMATTGDAESAALDALPNNLLEIVDSFGFVQIIFALEEQLEIDLDLEGVDLADLTRPLALIKFLRKQANTDAAITPL